MLTLLRMRDIIRMSLRVVFRRRQRYLHIAAIVAIGTAGLIVAISTRGEIKKKANEDLDLLGGATILQVYYEPRPLNEPWTAKERVFYWHPVHAVEQIPGVRAVSMIAAKSSPAQVAWGKRQGAFQLISVDAYFWRLHSFQALDGTFFDRAAVENGERVCVIGADVARLLYDRTDVAGRFLIVDHELYRIAGVIDGIRVGEGTRFLFVPLTTALARSPDMTLPSRLFIRCNSWMDVESVAAALPAVLSEYLPTDRLRVETFWETLRRVQRVAFQLELFANVSLMITFAVGGLGIWNSQSAAVRARTREIGIKKAAGARNVDILTEFLAESVVLCIAAAIAGVFLGAAAVEVISLRLGNHPSLGLFGVACATGVGFAAALGIAAGLYPACKAGRMEVATALRHE